ncbi:MAG: PKD domain-containing protein [Gemmatimonadales bacterium]
MIRATAVVGAAWLAAGCGGSGRDLFRPDQPPVAGFTTVCQGQACSFTDASSDADGTIVGYHWDFGDQSAGDSGKNVRHAFAGAGSFVVALTVTDDQGASGRAGSVVHLAARVNTPPAASFTATCSHLTCSFADSSTDTDGRIASYRWSFGDAAPDGTEKDATHSYGAPGDYTVELAVTDDSGATTQATQAVHVLGLSNLYPQAAFGMMCVGFACAFSDSSADPDGRIVHWHWDFDDKTSSDVRNPSHTFRTADTYVVLLTVTDNSGAKSSAGQHVQVPVGPTVLAVSPAHLSFQLHVFRTGDHPSQTMTVTNLRPGRIGWKVGSHPTWLTIAPLQGTTPGTASVVVNRVPPPIGINGYRPPSVSGAFTVYGLGMPNGAVTVPVTVFLRYTQ